MHRSGKWGNIWTNYIIPGKCQNSTQNYCIASFSVYYSLPCIHLTKHTVTDSMVNLTPNFLVSQQQGWWHELLDLIKNRLTWTQICVCNNKDKNYQSCLLLKANFDFKFSTIICFETHGLTDQTVQIMYEVYTQTLVMHILLNQLHCFPYKCTVFNNIVYGHFTIIPKQLYLQPIHRFHEIVLAWIMLKEFDTYCIHAKIHYATYSSEQQFSDLVDILPSRLKRQDTSDKIIATTEIYTIYYITFIDVLNIINSTY